MARAAASLRQALMLENGGVISLVGSGGKTSLMFRVARELSKAGESVLTTTTTRIFMPAREQSSSVIQSDDYEEILDVASKYLKETSHLTVVSATGSDPGKLKGLEPDTVDKIWQSGLFRWIVVEADGAAGRPLKAPAEHEPVIPLSSRWVVGVVGLDAFNRPLEEKWVFRPEIFARVSGLSPGDLITAGSISRVLLHPAGIFKGCPSHSVSIAFLNKADSPGRVEAGRSIARLLAEDGKNRLNRIVLGKVLREPPVVEYY
ncbi:MAG: selenium cofactor biosynthesis protein YqeC [Desulfobacterales bacterium]|nr:selenium cofactor biosynthesis protein YqeC [Desulfobacterales bacterium]